MSDMQLNLNPQNNPNTEGNQNAENKPVMGWFAVAFGFLGIFTIGVVFVPLGLLCSILALFFGQIVWGFIGLLLAVMGFITSPQLWVVIGMAAFYQWFDLGEVLLPFFDLIGVEPPKGKDI